MIQMNGQLITPYQGKKRCFGEFKCEKCGKEWKSSNSKANETQTCSSCFNQCYPFKQIPLHTVYEDLRNKRDLKLVAIQEALKTN
jgi:hypothetical protein